MKILIAFDKFKDCMSASAANKICQNALIDLGYKESELLSKPISDGGEGFAEALAKGLNGQLHSIKVQGPKAGEYHTGHYALIDDFFGEKTAVIESAQAGGIEWLDHDERDLWTYNSYGCGEFIGEALSRGAKHIIVGLGGTATHDLGLGCLSALGLKVLDRSGQKIFPVTPRRFSDIAGLNWQSMLDIKDARLTIASDVNNPLCGPQGAARVYGPQKGLSAEDIEFIDKTSKTLVQLMCLTKGLNQAMIDEPGNGAGGGLGFGLKLVFPYQQRSGFEMISDLFCLEKDIKSADLIITGEGKFDDSSLSGKGPMGIIRLCQKYKKQCFIFAGHVDLSSRKAITENLFIKKISPQDLPLKEALEKAPDLLFQTVKESLLSQKEEINERKKK